MRQMPTSRLRVHGNGRNYPIEFDDDEVVLRFLTWKTW